MVYAYVCKEKSCTCKDIKIEINKPISKSSHIEKCVYCNSELVRVYGVGGIKTSDGVK